MRRFVTPFAFRNIVFYVPLVLISGSIVVAHKTVAEASSSTWFSQEAPTLIRNPDQSAPADKPSCINQQITVDKNAWYNYFDMSDTSAACVYDKGGWRYALSSRGYMQWSQYLSDNSFVVGVGHDSKMYRVNNLSATNVPHFIPYSNSLAYKVGYGSVWGQKLIIYKDIIARLQKTAGHAYDVTDVDSPDYELTRPNGNPLPIGVVASASNGKWLVAEVIGVGIVRLNLETYEVKRIANVAPQYGIGMNPSMSLTISDDGKYIVIGGRETPFIIYQVSDSCGDDVVTNEMTYLTPVSNSCAERQLDEHMRAELPRFYAADFLQLNDAATEIKFSAMTYGENNSRHQTEYVLNVPGHKPSISLDYLAMGDSYSSGEGDIQVNHGRKYYLFGTDVEGNSQTPREKCHISSRSYPFLLRTFMNIPDERMKSVACSGAEIDADYMLNKVGDNYHGQSSRLAGFRDSEDALKLEALTSFTPGRVKQLEFIEKYRPLTITLTGGGNDIGFEDIIKGCIMSNYYACKYNSTQQGRAMIGQGIANQYHSLTKLFAEIRTLSPTTKIYMVGYPQFVDSDSFFCAPNVPISQAERVMINEAVIYLNQVIKSAADNSGVKYIDIEDSLDGHKLCEKGTSYVTGLALARDLFFGNSLFGRSEKQESFHPNKSGHALIAKAIIESLGSESLLNYSDYPSNNNPLALENIAPPSYFSDAMSAATKFYKKGVIISRDYVQKAPSTDMFNIHFGGFEPFSQVVIENHSDPVVLGTYTTDEDGYLSADISVPSSIPAGFHTLHLIGKSYSGEEIDLWQGIEVRGVEGDVDEDGVPDDADACMYVSAIGEDSDHDGLDDACDPILEEEVQTNYSFNDVAFIDKQPQPLDIEDNTNNKYDYENKNIQDEIKSLFYSPKLVTDDTKIGANKSSKVIYWISSALIAGSILYWVIKRYSKHNDM